MGSSRAHGPHHDAQKLTTTGLPRRSLTPTLEPSSCWMARSGAEWPRRCGLAIAACCRPHPSDAIRAMPKTIAPAEIKPDLTFNALSLVEPRRSIGKGIRGGDAGVEVAAGLDPPLERLAVDLDQPEAHRVAPSPLSSLSTWRIQLGSALIPISVTGAPGTLKRRMNWSPGRPRSNAHIWPQ